MADDGFIRPMPVQSGGDLTSTLAHGAQHAITATMPGDIDLQEPRPFTVVYTGLIGQEPGIIGHRLSAEKFYVSFYGYPDVGNGQVLKFDLSGNVYQSYPSGTSPGKTFNIAVNNGDRYVDDESYTVYRNGSPFISIPTLPNGLWHNAQHLFIAALSDGSGNDPVVFKADPQSGNIIDTLNTATPSIQFNNYYQTVSASDTMLCVTGEGYNVVTLFDTHGNFVKELVTSSTLAIAGCASGRDRHFVHTVHQGGIGHLQVCDANGNYLTDVQMGGESNWSFGMAVSDNYVLVPNFYTNTVSVVRRERDSAGAETYVYAGVIDLAGPSVYPYDASSDLSMPYQ
jgi:hypothetical protein